MPDVCPIQSGRYFHGPESRAVLQVIDSRDGRLLGLIWRLGPTRVQAIHHRCRDTACERNILCRCVNARVCGIPVLPEPSLVKWKNDSIGVYPGQDLATATHYLEELEQLSDIVHQSSSKGRRPSPAVSPTLPRRTLPGTSRWA